MKHRANPAGVLHNEAMMPRPASTSCSTRRGSTRTTDRRRDVRQERAFIPSDLDDLAELLAELRAAEVPPAEANGIIGWLVGKWSGRPDETHSTTRAKYRRRLDQLAAARLDLAG